MATNSEHKSYGLAWSDADVQRFMKLRGEDVLHSVQSAQAQFNTKLAAGG